MSLSSFGGDSENIAGNDVGSNHSIQLLLISRLKMEKYVERIIVNVCAQVYANVDNFLRLQISATLKTLEI